MRRNDGVSGEMGETAEGSGHRSHLDRAMADLWPDMPESESALWAVIPDARKERAVARLAAIRGLTSEDGGPPRHAGMADAAKAAGTSLTTIYTIAKRWRAAPSLEALGVYASRTPAAGVGSSGERSGMLRDVGRMLRDDPAAGNVDIRRRLGETFGRTPSFTTVKRLVQDARRVMPPSRPFGSDVILDSAGLDVFYDEGIPTRLYAVVDRGTGLVLGWELWSHDDPAGGYARAAHHALSGVRSSRGAADDPPSGMSNLALAGMRSTTPSSVEVRTLPEDVGKLNVFANADTVTVVGDVSLGSAVVEAVGERVASVWIGTGRREAGRSYRTGRIEEMPLLRSRLRRSVDEALHGHDLHRLELMPRDGGPDGASEAVAALRALLLPISADADIGGLAR